MTGSIFHDLCVDLNGCVCFLSVHLVAELSPGPALLVCSLSVMLQLQWGYLSPMNRDIPPHKQLVLEEICLLSSSLLSSESSLILRE